MDVHPLTCMVHMPMQVLHELRVEQRQKMRAGSKGSGKGLAGVSDGHSQRRLV